MVAINNIDISLAEMRKQYDEFVFGHADEPSITYAIMFSGFTKVLLDKILTLETRFEQYAAHKPYCIWFQGEFVNKDCDCGLDKPQSHDEWMAEAAE